MKFAYLIMAHHKFSVLKLLLEDLDDKRNDIFVHIDKKCADFHQEELQQCVKKANLIFIKRKPVYWGDYSQIKCVVSLLKAAVNYGHHDYYHLLVGVEFPLKSQDYIHDFFAQNAGYEFIGFDSADKKYIERVKYWYVWGKYARPKNKFQSKLYTWTVCLINLQKKLGVNRVRGRENNVKKGYANWSITHELACYILEQFRYVKKKCWFTVCADEVFIHTIVFNSVYYDKVYDKKNEMHSAMRLTTWDNVQSQLHMSDYGQLISTERLFGRKFDDEDAEELIYKIKQNRR